VVTKAAFYWNGAAADGGGNFTLQPGISPSTAVLRFPLSTPISQIGTLTLTNGTQTINFSRCRVVRIVINESGGGGRWREVTIEDRRWMWADFYTKKRWGELQVFIPVVFNTVECSRRG
jgi:hypothetical protein